MKKETGKKTQKSAARKRPKIIAQTNKKTSKIQKKPVNKAKKSKKGKINWKIIAGSSIGVAVLATSLGLGLYYGLKKDDTSSIEPIFAADGPYPVKVVWATDNKEARLLLKDIYEGDEVLYKTYIKYDSTWGNTFAEELIDAEIVILVGVQFGSNYNTAKNTYGYHFDIRIFNNNRKDLYDVVKEWNQNRVK